MLRLVCVKAEGKLGCLRNFNIDIPGGISIYSSPAKLVQLTAEPDTKSLLKITASF